jgi:hypothetical protein
VLRTNAITGIAIAVAMALGGAGVDAGAPEDLNFAGSAGGGTLSITTTADRSGVLRAELNNVAFSSLKGCDATASAVRYYDPPEPIGAGSFSITLWFIGATSGAVDYVNVQGSFASETTLSGSAVYTAAFGPEEGCFSDPVSWSAGGPADTPPGPDDLLFEGSLVGTDGAISLTTNAERTGITSVTLDGAALPCAPDDGLVDVRAFLEPAASFDQPVTISFTPSDPLDSHGLTITVEQPDAQTLGGTIASFWPIPSCSGETGFLLQLVPGPTPTSTATAPTTPPAPTTPAPTAARAEQTPAATAAPVALPETGGSGGAGATAWWVVPGVVGLALVGGAAIVGRRPGG